MTESRIVATTLVLPDGGVYRYTEDATEALGYRFYRMASESEGSLDPSRETYVEVDPSTPLYIRLVQFVEEPA